MKINKAEGHGWCEEKMIAFDDRKIACWYVGIGYHTPPEALIELAC